MAKVFPEVRSAVPAPSAEDNGYIPSSQSVGFGHEDSMNRLPDPNAEWSNEETGEGTDGNPKS